MRENLIPVKSGEIVRELASRLLEYPDKQMFELPFYVSPRGHKVLLRPLFIKKNWYVPFDCYALVDEGGRGRAYELIKTVDVYGKDSEFHYFVSFGARGPDGELNDPSTIWSSVYWREEFKPNEMAMPSPPL